jgi:hypothetical protein
MPSMIIHFLGNATINTLSGYMIQGASTETEVLYQIVIAFGILPTTRMILWTRFFTSRWLPANKKQDSLDANETDFA